MKNREIRFEVNGHPTGRGKSPSEAVPTGNARDNTSRPDLDTTSASTPLLRMLHPERDALSRGHFVTSHAPSLHAGLGMIHRETFL